MRGEQADHLVRTHGWHYEYVAQGGDEFLRGAHEREHQDHGCDWLHDPRHEPHDLDDCDRSLAVPDSSGVAS